MTIGEKIQSHRKRLGMSQDELGQKLHVSRQTISLWEKDQTVPTIDNLIRLKDIFGISVDEILGVGVEREIAEELPNEIYQFNFTEEEFKEINRLQRRKFYKRPAILIFLCVLYTIFAFSYPDSEYLLSFVIGVLLVTVVYHVKGIRAFNKAWKSSSERVCKATYEYKVFDDYFKVNIYRNGEKIREAKCYYTDIEQMQQVGMWLLIQFGGQSFILRKIDLKENSALYSYMYKNPTKTKDGELAYKRKNISDLLFISSILSFFVAVIIWGYISNANKLFTENIWILFLFTPIPIASLVFGCVSNKTGYKFKKNIVVGIIMTALLCLYGSFYFAFADTYDHSDEPIIKIEKTIGIDIPEHSQINTHYWTKGIESVSRGYIYCMSDIYFGSDSVEAFEKQLENDDRWLSSVPNDLIGVTSPLGDGAMHDYSLIYNTDTDEINSLPDDNGIYRFINILYNTEDNQMRIIEYDIDYVK